MRSMQHAQGDECMRHFCLKGKKQFERCGHDREDVWARVSCSVTGHTKHNDDPSGSGVSFPRRITEHKICKTL
jgi:hypothetical protein